MSSADDPIKHNLEVARQQLQLLADMTNPAIAYLDTQRRFEMSNDTFKRRFGHPDRETAAGDFFDGVCSPAVDEYLCRAMESGTALNAQLDCSGPNNDTDRLRLRAVPLVTSHGTDGVFVVFEELETRAIELEENAKAEADNERMIHLQRMAKLGEMAAGLAHEVRQPLAAISNYASALKRMLPTSKSDVDAAALVEQISDQAVRADNIIGNARSMIGQGHDHIRDFSIQSVVEESIGLIERRARELDVDVRLSVQSELPVVRGNPPQIEQILVNLMTNAMDSMAECDTRVLRIDVEAINNHMVRTRVRDTGAGIPADRLSSIFDAFDTTKPGGMGMGLALSRALAERHGGQLWAETDVAEGASFVLEVPARAASDENAEDA